MAVRDAQAAVPALPAARRVAVAGGNLSYFVNGDPQGRPLVLCHGLAASGLQFIEDAAFFADNGFFVIVPDLRGHGRSKLDGGPDGARFGFAQLAVDLLAMLDEEGIARTDWVGNSLGGIVGLSLMGTQPERINRFVSFGTAYALDLPEPIVPAMAFANRLLGIEAIARLGAPLTTPHARAQAIIYEMLRGADFDAVSRVGRGVLRYDLLAAALAFERPILMIRGMQDSAVNLALQSTIRAMASRGNFSVVDVEDAGHCANLDQPEKVRGIILDFLLREEVASG